MEINVVNRASAKRGDSYVKNKKRANFRKRIYYSSVY